MKLAKASIADSIFINYTSGILIGYNRFPNKVRNTQKDCTSRQ